VTSGEGGSPSVDRPWKLLLVDGELAPPPPTFKCVRRGVGTRSTGFVVSEHFALGRGCRIIARRQEGKNAIQKRLRKPPLPSLQTKLPRRMKSLFTNKRFGIT
jgi:hypothetical protein